MRHRPRPCEEKDEVTLDPKLREPGVCADSHLQRVLVTEASGVRCFSSNNGGLYAGGGS